MKQIVVIGTGTFGQIAKDYFEEYLGVKVNKFAVTEDQLSQDENKLLNLISTEELAQQNPDNYQIFVAVGYRKMNSVREYFFNHFQKKGFEFLSFVHPNVKIWNSTSIGQNCFIFEDNTIQPFTEIGSNTILWSGNHIGHHTFIGANCFISSHVVISGSCQVGDNSFIGVNASIHDGVKIGDRTLIGAGAVISRNTLPDSIHAPKPTLQSSKKSFEIDF
jgi:sugar O-acyltransferase (sialic acid O-acetyltransferase NeuD family)